METRSKSAKGNASRSKPDPRCIENERDVLHSTANDSTEAPRKTAIVEPTLTHVEGTAECITEPQCKLVLKVLMTRFSRSRVRMTVVGNPTVDRALDGIQQNPTYKQHVREVRLSCTSFLDAVQDAVNVSKDPRTPVDTSEFDTCVNIRGLADEDFDVWFTVEVDRSPHTKTRVGTGPKCPVNVKRVLTEGPVEYDMKRVWEPMTDLLCYVLLTSCQ